MSDAVENMLRGQMPDDKQWQVYSGQHGVYMSQPQNTSTTFSASSALK